MAELKRSFMYDVVFKILFITRQDLLKQLVAALLDIPLAGIDEFSILETPPGLLEMRHCCLCMNMTVNGQLTELQIRVQGQVEEEDYPQRFLAESAALSLHSVVERISGVLPRLTGLNIVDFSVSDDEEYHISAQFLENTSHMPMTDRVKFHFFQLPKLPEPVSADRELELWLALFKAETDEDLAKLEALGVPVIQEAIRAYHRVIAMSEFECIERLREIAARDDPDDQDIATAEFQYFERLRTMSASKMAPQ